MWCAKNAEDLKSYFLKSFGSWLTVDKAIDNLDSLVKEHNKCFKNYKYWTEEFKRFENPKDNKEAFGNNVAAIENSGHSLYKAEMEKAVLQFNAIAEAIIEHCGSDEKLLKSVLKKIETRRNRMNK